MANEQGMIVEDVRRFVSAGMHAFDAEGRRLGDVDQYDGIAGWLSVERLLPSDPELFIPYSRVKTIDPRELYVSLTKDELERDFTSPPARTTVVVPGDGLRPKVVTTEASGYTGTPIVVARADLERLRPQVQPGMSVLTWDNASLGKVHRYDPITGWMEVVKGLLERRDMYLPLTLVDSVDAVAKEIHLSVAGADVDRMTHTGPADILFVEATAK